MADTGAVIALLDADDRHHEALRTLFLEDQDAWLLPWSILPEVDYLLATHVGARVAESFIADLGAGAFRVAWGEDHDLERARQICARYRSLRLGLVDATVIALAERRKAAAIATLDLRHFGAVAIEGQPRLLPRDL